ncbi:uncharacterized protein [Parasteatoda tepidariorum]|uniref:uncharacterized protein n=1 Tax=Parasteatoda tepidariorum TaxID=114398 RepID=UPI0039BC3402
MAYVSKVPLRTTYSMGFATSRVYLHIEYVSGKCSVVPGMLSRPVCPHGDNLCEICAVTVYQPTVATIYFPTRSPKEIRKSQLQDENLKEIIDSLEIVNLTEEYRNWTERRFLMNRGILYRYVPDSDEAHLVIPEHDREQILKFHHDAPTAGHGAEGTFDRISRRYYWMGMRKYITNYVTYCIECMR